MSGIENREKKMTKESNNEQEEKNENMHGKAKITIVELEKKASEKINKEREEKEKFKPGKSKIAIIALIFAILAFVLSVQERMFSKSKSLKSINSMLSNVVVPEIKKSKHIDTVKTIYELKHIMITLEQLKETSESPEIKMQVDQLMKQIEDLSVKAFIHE